MRESSRYGWTREACRHVEAILAGTTPAELVDELDAAAIAAAQRARAEDERDAIAGLVDQVHEELRRRNVLGLAEVLNGE